MASISQDEINHFLSDSSLNAKAMSHLVGFVPPLSEQDREDIVQSALLNTWVRASISSSTESEECEWGFAVEAQLASFFWKAVDSLAVNLNRSRAVRRLPDQANPGSPLTHIEKYARQRPDHGEDGPEGHNPVASSGYREEVHVLRRRVDRLSEDQRAAVRSRVINGCPLRMTAAQLGVSLSTAHRLHQSAIDAMRQEDP